ncbi:MULTISPECIES: CBO0543 family protein [unclassified Bacillus (in: firmicutes)]|uniref:CBO0543 family protein n=1 Tax=unclassified Bacillus (in: firmicutes) TaxID=185979 RepID=UPI0008F355D5|nr:MULTISPECIES: CBO0543 family protein [unclassified Bacillus (in: firmicutes)]SFA87143.1 hypothetical protein SAMN02799634_102202 [Bacillus sp. UNCCL13]SFQ84097.1 hypothetical protein SAMN04488577_2322 [Bacillus sp. cl95]
MNVPTFDDVLRARELHRDLAYQHWISDEFLTWKWWFLLAFSILPWVLWVLFRDKKRTYEILSYGLLWASIAALCDIIGSNLILWSYPDKLFPMAPPLIPADLAVIPVSFMFVYQYTKHWKSYIICSLLVSAIFSFLIETIFIKWDMFAVHYWHHMFSFIGFSILSGIIYWTIKKLDPSEKE